MCVSFLGVIIPSSDKPIDPYDARYYRSRDLYGRLRGSDLDHITHAWLRARGLLLAQCYALGQQAPTPVELNKALPPTATQDVHLRVYTYGDQSAGVFSHLIPGQLTSLKASLLQREQLPKILYVPFGEVPKQHEIYLKIELDDQKNLQQWTIVDSNRTLRYNFAAVEGTLVEAFSETKENIRLKRRVLKTGQQGLLNNSDCVRWAAMHLAEDAVKSVMPTPSKPSRPSLCLTDSVRVFMAHAADRYQETPRGYVSRKMDHPWSYFGGFLILADASVLTVLFYKNILPSMFKPVRFATAGLFILISMVVLYRNHKEVYFDTSPVGSTVRNTDLSMPLPSRSPAGSRKSSVAADDALSSQAIDCVHFQNIK